MGIIVKGDKVAFSTTNQRAPDLFLPARYGIVHDPNGTEIPRCVVYFSPFRKVRGEPEITPEARKYFGSDYDAEKISTDRPPESRWSPFAHVSMIFYVRRGKHAGGYHHPFRKPLILEKSGRFYRLSLTPGSNSCIIDDRGFVFP